MLKKLNFKNKTIVIVLMILVAVVSCKQKTYTPKPKGYYRLELPTKDSILTFIHTDCDFSFQYPNYINIEQDTLFFDEAPDHPCWLNLNYPMLNATIHVSYKPLSSNSLAQLTEDYHTIKNKHVIKADYIDEAVLKDTIKQNYGLLSQVGGDVASTYQFYLTDSTNHFLRGALYFKTDPNVDSLQPAIHFVKEDILQLLNTFQWNN